MAARDPDARNPDGGAAPQRGHVPRTAAEGKLPQLARPVPKTLPWYDPLGPFKASWYEAHGFAPIVTNDRVGAQADEKARAEAEELERKRDIL
eukprot:CAMPEP_0167805396 /NCGR_PEP_ID=MMETSP0111_2-20121227/21152_1 /TAXON_ID=91324 /ORGANISM="Lotharella globosa, Strain CCCM811" /LENGTH=92 /DNA_ID=CAMNT_0007702539 /DNA_START=99 /DNA_END=374 /DNA_ORIENTATION=+